MRFLKKVSLEKIVKETVFDTDLKSENEELRDLIYYTSQDTLMDNPIYRAALSCGDSLLPVQLRLYYRLAGIDDCRLLGKVLRRRVLPSLGKEYDRVFAIPCKEIDFALLERSGYQIWHRPYFAMRRGSTHSVYKVNPHTKYILDAGFEDSEPTSFEDFLKLFNAVGYK